MLEAAEINRIDDVLAPNYVNTSMGVTDLAGTYNTDPTLRDICAEAYRSRDAERHQA